MGKGEAGRVAGMQASEDWGWNREMGVGIGKEGMGTGLGHVKAWRLLVALYLTRRGTYTSAFGV